MGFTEFAINYYRKDGKPTNEVRMIKGAIKIARQLYGRDLAIKFGPLALKACRQKMIELGWCRNNINRQTDRIKRMIKWATENEMIPGTVYQALRCVKGLKRGRTDAKESKRIKPVTDADIRATLKYLPAVVSDMVRLERLTGARPSEICDIRPMDINRETDPWEYIPQSHKTEHHDQSRVILIGPKGQNILRPYLERAADAYCFSPSDTVAQQRAQRHQARKTPLKYGNTIGTNRKRSPKRRPGKRYNAQSYFLAVQRACDQAFPVPTEIESNPSALAKWRAKHRWSPNQLRHAAATEFRKQYGLEAAQVLLGHSRADVTQVYAERDYRLASRVAKAIG